MKQAYNTQSQDDQIYCAADQHYAMLKDSLISREFGDLSEADTERWLQVEGQELLRRLLQSHLTLRGRAQALMTVVGSDGVQRTYIRPGKVCALETTFGEVTVERTAYATRDAGALYPVDAWLNLPAAKYSHEVERQVAMSAARMSFCATLLSLQALMRAHVPKRQAKTIVQRAANNYKAFYAKTGFEISNKTNKLLMLSFDQKGVVMRPSDLTEATQKAAQASRPKHASRRSKGEPSRGRKRMAMVAAVYTVAPHVHSAADIIDGLRHVRAASPAKRPRPENKRVWASLELEPEQVVAAAFDEAEKRDPAHCKRWLVVVDGDDKLARWVRAEAKRRGVKVTLVLDFIHALEYLWRAARVFFDEGSTAIEPWVLQRLRWLLEGKAIIVAASMTRKATKLGLNAKARKPVDTAARYLLNRKEMMRYNELLALGTPIASGIIEGACRHLINDRLDVTGARWSLAGAEAVLRLRSLLSSGDFDAYWRFHEEQGCARHASNYASGEVPEVGFVKKRRHLRLVGGVD